MSRAIRRAIKLAKRIGRLERIIAYYNTSLKQAKKAFKGLIDSLSNDEILEFGQRTGRLK